MYLLDYIAVPSVQISQVEIIVNEKKIKKTSTRFCIIICIYFAEKNLVQKKLLRKFRLKNTDL